MRNMGETVRNINTHILQSGLISHSLSQKCILFAVTLSQCKMFLKLSVGLQFKMLDCS